jgi:pyruvate-formate lyase
VVIDGFISTAAAMIAASLAPQVGDYLIAAHTSQELGHQRMMEWLAGVYVNAMNVIHYMHDKYAYERIEMALHDYAPVRTMAFGIAGLSIVADSLSAIRHARVKVVRDETGTVTGYTCYLKDVSYVRNLEARLKISERNYIVLFDTILNRIACGEHQYPDG